MSLNRVRAACATDTGQCPCGCATRERTYPTDLTDQQWAVLEPLLPVPLCRTELGGRPEKHHRRTVINAIFYLVDNGIKWRAMPADFPPWRTVYGVVRRWGTDKVPQDLADELRAMIRRAAGRDREPSAAIIDAQSVHESAEGVVPAATSGFDPHKKVNGRKRHLLVDTLGLLIAVTVSKASLHDRDAGPALLRTARRRGRTRLAHVWGDKAYHGNWTTWAQHKLGITIEVVARPEGQKGFTVLPRRWVVERTNAWITRRRRCARDYERLPARHADMVRWAAIIQMTRRAAKITPTPPRV